MIQPNCVRSLRECLTRHSRAFLVTALAFATATIADPAAASSVDDSFAGNALDWCRWEDTSYQATVAQSEQLTLSPDASGTYSSARVHSQARLIGDFDVQV